MSLKPPSCQLPECSPSPSPTPPTHSSRTTREQTIVGFICNHQMFTLSGGGKTSEAYKQYTNIRDELAFKYAKIQEHNCTAKW